MIGDRKFAAIVQPFLHEYGEIKIGHIGIVAPYEEDPDGPHPRVRAWQNKRPLRFIMAEAQMPANIKSFKRFWLRFNSNFFRYKNKIAVPPIIYFTVLFGTVPTLNFLIQIFRPDCAQFYAKIPTESLVGQRESGV
jgi:hypothetical protein